MKRAVTILLTFALFAAGAGASARGDDSTPPKDPKKERDRVRRERAAKASQLDALQSDAKDVDQALDELQGYISYQENQLDDAKVGQDQANADAVSAQADVQAIEAEIARLQQVVKDAIIRAYTSAGSQPNLFTNLLAKDPVDELQRQMLYDLATGNVEDSIDELESKHRDLAAAKKKADKAVKRADANRLKVEGKIADLTDAVAKQNELSDKIDARIDETLSEAANLESLDTKLSQEIAAREAALAEKARRDAERAAKIAAAKANVPTATVSDEGSIDVPIIPTAANGLVKVNGITVDASIGPAIAQLVAWAAADGFSLTGGGYRNAQAQIDTRRANCGSSTYDIWQKPPSQCHPPAARPGHSMHEKGLAVDFACNGQLIATYSSPCYHWMAEHAPRVGLKNRRGEAWHWSTNGN